MNRRLSIVVAALFAILVSAAGPTLAAVDLGICQRLFHSLGWEAILPQVGHGLHVPQFRKNDPTQVPEIRIVSLENQGLDPEKLSNVPAMKEAMRNGTFGYSEGRISGQYHETSGTFLLSEGHHRVVAALEVAAETGNWEPFNHLIDYGKWSRIDLPTTKTVVPLPVRRFDVPRARQREMATILRGMRAPWYLRMDWNWLR